MKQAYQPGPSAARIGVCLIAAWSFGIACASDAAVLPLGSSAESIQQANPLAAIEVDAIFDAGRRALTNKDYLAAYRWLQDAAQRGHAQAQTSLGLLYAHGLGVAMDEELALAWFARAAEQGDVAAQTNLAAMYLCLLYTSDAADE